MAMCDEIADYLASLNDGVVGVDIFTHHKPATPDACISVHQFVLGRPTLVMTGVCVAESVGLQIQVRDVASQAAETRCYTIFDQLNGLANRTLGSTRYLGVTGRKSPTQLKMDQERRVIYSCEFAVIKNPA